MSINAKRRGFSVIEVIIALGMAAIVSAAVGNLIVSTHRLDGSSGLATQATAYARQWLDILPTQANQDFGVNAAASYTASDGQTCTVSAARASAGFTSCWVDRPIGLSTANLLKLVAVGNSWQLQDADTTPDSPAGGFTRTMTVTNLNRDANGAIVSTGGSPDLNTKQITVTVAWKDGGATRQTQLSSILTAWKNF